MRRKVNGFIGRLGRKVSRFDITVGCDPEFEVFDTNTNQVVSAASRINSSTSDEIGADGAGGPVELRPKAAVQPITVVKNLRNLIRKFAGKYRHYNLSYASATYAIGGHIHVGIKGVHIGHEFAAAVSAVLDDFIGRRVVGLAGPARARSVYNRLGAFELKPWGFEYRTPTAETFAHPRFALLCMKIARMVAFRLANSKSISYDLVYGEDGSGIRVPGANNYSHLGNLRAKEYEEFQSLLASFRSKDVASKTSDLYANWKVTRPTRPIRTARTGRFFVGFSSDVFGETIRRAFTTAVDELNRERRTSSTPWIAQDVNIHFFGLHSDRGLAVSGLDGTSFNRYVSVQHQYASVSLQYRRITVGLPFALRTIVGDAEVLPIVREIVRAAAERFINTCPRNEVLGL